MSTVSSPAAGLLTARFWRGYALTLRPYLLFVSGAAGLVGIGIGMGVGHVNGTAGEPSTFRAAAAFLALFASYGLGQALTDVFQVDTDSLSSPYRPLVRGEIAKSSVLVVSLAGLALAGLVLAAGSPVNLLLAAAAVAGLLAYTPCKRRWWAGPPCNSAVMALLPPMGAFAVGVPWPGSAAGGSAIPLLLASAASVFGTYAVFVVIGYLKDVEADRATGYVTVAVRFGRRAAVLASAATCLLGLAGSALLLRFLPGGPLSLPGAVLWLAGVVLLVATHRKALSVTRDDEAHPAVALSVRGFLALHAGEAVLLAPSLLPVAAGLVVLFEVALAARPCREQV